MRSKLFGFYYDDQYAAKIWLPGVFGLMHTGYGLMVEPMRPINIVIGILFLIWAAVEWRKRLNRKKRLGR